MLFTLFVAALAAALWTLRSFVLDGTVPHDPTTLELSVMAAVTLTTFGWMRRLRSIRASAIGSTGVTPEGLPPTPVAARYSEALAEVQREETPLRALVS